MGATGKHAPPFGQRLSPHAATPSVATHANTPTRHIATILFLQNPHNDRTEERHSAAQ
jgi:hypothetical protein